MAKSKEKKQDGADASLAAIRGYIAAQSGKGRDSCPHGDGPLRVAWLDGYAAGVRAMAAWEEDTGPG